MTQNNLGLAFWALGERESGTVGLQAAITAFRNVLKEWTSSNDFATRVQNLRNGSGGNAHNAGSLLLPNVRDDLSADAVDFLNGAAGDDWLLLLFGEDKISGQSEMMN